MITGKRALADMLTRECSIYRRAINKRVFNLYRVEGNELQSRAGEDLSEVWSVCCLSLEYFLDLNDFEKVR